MNRCEHCPVVRSGACLAERTGHARFCELARDRPDYRAMLVASAGAAEAVSGLRSPPTVESRVEIGEASIFSRVANCKHRSPIDSRERRH